jgi:hypothetical protein
MRCDLNEWEGIKLGSDENSSYDQSDFLQRVNRSS